MTYSKATYLLLLATVAIAGTAYLFGFSVKLETVT